MLNLIFNYLKKYTSYLILGGMSIIILSILLLPTPFITRHILDEILPNKDLENLIFFISLIFCLLLIQKVLSFYQNLLFYKINTKIIYDIKLDLLKKINNLPIKISKEYGTGYLISRINSDTGRLRSLFADTIIHIIKDVLTFLVGLGAIFYLHWKLALISIGLLPFFIITTIYFAKKIRNLSKIYYEDDSQTIKQLEETLSMIELVKQFSRQNFNIIKYLSKANISFRSNIKLGKISFVNNFIVGLIGGLAPIIIIGYGGYEIINDRLTIGSLIAFNSFVGYLFGPTNRLINVNVQIQKALVALERITELFNLPEQKKDGKYKLDKVNSLEIRNLNYCYEDKNENILTNLNLKIDSGNKIGIVGNSGSGKTTLLRILSGLYEIENGKVIVNNEELTNPQIVALRKYIAVVEQEPFLFNDTIYNNIKLGKATATKEEIVEISKKSHIDEFINKLPEKYNTQVGNKGNNLSVGQKQRIEIARALLKNPKILILDEATSSIDNFSEKYITETIKNLPKDMIVIIVAHRLSTIKDCDKIFVMDKGTIVEEGKHDELMNKKGLYFELNSIMEK